MINWIDVLANEERYRDKRREAEKERLVHQALAVREKRNPIYGPALIWLGRRLATWGRRLQEPHSAASRSSQASGC